MENLHCSIPIIAGCQNLKDSCGCICVRCNKCKRFTKKKENKMEKEDILKTLEPLFEQAEKEGLWFYSTYQDLWFTPKELRSNQANGTFVWGVVNWKLRKPQEKIDSLESLKLNIENQIREFKEKIKSA